jgi:predicted outer membrane repeat protein
MDTSPVLENIHLVNCHAEADGGGLFCDPGSVVRFSGEFRDNEVGGYGGGCAAGSYASLTVHDSLISGNQSGEYGGGIAALNSGTIQVLDSTITGNHSASGGGISTVTYGIVRKKHDPGEFRHFIRRRPADPNHNRRDRNLRKPDSGQPRPSRRRNENVEFGRRDY